MATTIKPVIYKTQETLNYLDELPDDIKSALGKEADLLLDHPVIYIHVWQSKYDKLNNTWSIYVGETNDLIGRTKQHWAQARVPKTKRSKGNWQYHMLEDVDINGKKVVPTVYFFGHKLFHKSLTLDIENRLIDYFLALPTTNTHNGRTNVQGCYSGDDNLDDIFNMIWRELRKDNPELFLSETEVQKSAIYKASPNHRLTDDQKKAKQLIIDRTVDAILNNKDKQLIFVEGEAGTGKTVLTSSTFYGVLENELLKDLDLSCYMLINHLEQSRVYQNMARKLGYKEDIIQKPTEFLNKHSKLNSAGDAYIPGNSPVDLVFVDEAHLLWSQHNQVYTKKYKEPQLDEIIKRARVTVIMFDENQVLHGGQITAMGYMEEKKALAKSQGPNPSNGDSNYIELKNQLRMNCSLNTMDWIDSFSKELELKDLFLDKKYCDEKGYEVRFFDNPSDMHNEIIKKSKNKESTLSRMIATSDWEYIDQQVAPWYQRYWQIDIDGWTMPWNEQIFFRDVVPTLSKRQFKKYKAFDWAEKDTSINEAGSTFTIQGFDLSYAGVILGPSVRYDKETKTIWFDEKERKQDYMKGNRKLHDGTTINITDIISKHELRVLMTRATKGLYIYAWDPDLRAALKDAIKFKP